MENKQAIIRLFAANTISGFAQGISLTGVSWYINSTLDQPVFYGRVFIVTTILSLFVGFYGGTLIDKFDRKKIFIVNSLIGIFFLGLATASGYTYGTVPIYFASFILVLTFMIYSIHYPNLYAFAQEISAPKDYGRITSYIEVQGQATTALAGVLAAILLKGTVDQELTVFGFHIPVGVDIRPWELHEIFLLDAITYILALSLIVGIRYKPIALRDKITEPLFNQLRTGFRFLKERPALFIFGNASFAIFATILLVNFYLVTKYIEMHLGGDVDVYGTFELYFALGSMTAGLFVHRIFKFTTSVGAIIIMTLTAAGVYFIHSANTTLAVFYLSMAFLGLCNAGTRVMRMTYLFKHVPNHIIGRTAGIFKAINTLFRLSFAAAFSWPFFFRDGNIVYVFVIMGIFLVAAALTLVVNYSRLTDRQPESNI